ncbi:hypothetical protein AQUCO_01700086v1 [Aquilegia coerulea]|uniref:Eukaryotic translation initiation factor 5B n=1 Tax=Aquilegia coerulea TaxID=218851 RepID=A0A2G5DLV7_AQUCA|nr:hypothetical protein AQUCO_01700086v1 [Aquilegia coerulea]
MGRKKLTVDENPVVGVGVGVGVEVKSKMNKKKKKNRGTAIDDDKENLSQKILEEEVKTAKVGKKKGKKKTTSYKEVEDDVLENVAEVDVGVVQKKKKSIGFSVFYAVDEDNDNVDVPAFDFGAKKKPSKKSSMKKSGSLLQDNGDAVVDDNDYVPAFDFGMKKKSSKKSKSKKSALDEQDNGDAEDNQSISNVNALCESNVKDDKVNNKKKKKKTGRTAQEEDDLDKILAELGEALPVAKATHPQPQVQIHSTELAEEKKEAEAETAESATAKKKKKKREKEKEKKAASASASAVAAVEVKEEIQETKSKVSDDNKKIPKHVIKMQEALARLKEAEEMQKKEEEEKLRREEEERQRLEEVARQAEEAKRRKKEREKEKMSRKKQEGKLLTEKQKKEALRLEAMRDQFLAGGAFPTNDTGACSTKRPKYQTKKAKPVPGQANSVQPVKSEDSTEAKEVKHEVVAKQDVVEVEKVEEIVSVARDAKQEEEVEHVVQENGGEEDEDDDDWDAKSWDDTTLNLVIKSAFDEEEVEGVAVPVAKKAIRPNIKQAPETAGALSAEAKPSDRPIFDSTDNKRIKEAAAKREPRAEEANSKPSADNLRSPICCIMGHVDTGKTKLLDCIRRTNVQEGEAGGITQQIGATYFPAENIRERTKELKEDATLRVPGLLVIDTPGHESFANLRSRGSGLCDIAILVVDIMHGLEPQTIESLNLLKMRNTNFIIALNKVDRLYGWKTCPDGPIVKTMKQQSNDVQNEFKMRVKDIINQFQMEGLNTELYYKNKKMGETLSIVPTSAISGEGVPDLLLLLVLWTQQKTMVERFMFSNRVQCTVLEIKVIEGLGTTIDVVLVNGVLHEKDQIVVCGMQGPIVTTIRALLTPHPMKELRIKGSYVHHKEIKAAQGIKITGQGLEHAIPGTALYVVGPDGDLDDAKEAAMEDMNSVMSRIDKSGEGVCVQASTLGSLEALLEFLKSPAVNIPVSGISIGPVHKKDVVKASVMLEKRKEYATILAFDVKVTPEASALADEMGVKILIADIIYHLFDQFKAYIDHIKEERKKEVADEAVFPCVLKIIPKYVFYKKDPIVVGVDVLEGIAKVGTPICIPSRDYIDIGHIVSIKRNDKEVDMATKGQAVSIKIAGTNPEEQQKSVGRHFEVEDELVSRITRSSIDVVKANYRDDLSKENWRLLVKLKNLFKIQ